jgi:C-terminal processing protease CtpA/Prc
VLLKVDDMDPEGSDSCRRPAGTKIRLTLKRGDKEFQTEIVLRDLIGPDVAAKTLKEPPR